MFVPVSKPLLGKKEVELVTEAVSRGEISGLSGTFVGQFEEMVATSCGAKYGAAVNSGTTALHLAVATLGIGPGDEVLVSTFTNMATFFAVLYQGAKPIPIDCDPETLNMDPSLLESKITSKTKAIIPVHIYGHPVDMDQVMVVAKKHHLFVIEDVAEAQGALYKGKLVGSIGDIGCLSFYSNKIVTTGEGGMLITNNKELADKARLLKNLAFGEKDKFMHRALGFKFQMTNVQAAIGVAQMTKFKEIMERKRAMAKYYLDHLKDLAQVRLPVEKDYAFNVYWMFNIVLAGQLSGKREQFMSELKKRGVETREDFVPYNQQEIFIKKNFTAPEDCPVVNTFYLDGLYLPSGTDISEAEQEYVVKTIRDVVEMLK